MEEDFEERPDEITEPDEELVDGLPVLAEVRPIERVIPPPLPTVHTAAAAATGFVAGAATVAFVRRRAARRAAQALSSPMVPGWPVAGTRTFLVHVHVIGRSAD